MSYIHVCFFARNGKNVMGTVEKILLGTEMFILTQKNQTSQILVPTDQHPNIPDLIIGVKGTE